MHCEICGRPHAHQHHIFTRGAFGKRAEVPENLIRLCYPHHASCHDLGRVTFAAIHGLERRFYIAEEAVRGHKAHLDNGNRPSPV